LGKRKSKGDIRGGDDTFAADEVEKVSVADVVPGRFGAEGFLEGWRGEPLKIFERCVSICGKKILRRSQKYS